MAGSLTLPLAGRVACLSAANAGGVEVSVTACSCKCLLIPRADATRSAHLPEVTFAKTLES